VLEEIKIEEKADREKTLEDRNNDLGKYLERAQQCADQSVLYNVDFYVSKAKETSAKLNKDISGELERLKPAYEKGISEMLKEAERYASEGQIYGMHVYIKNAINYAAKAGIDISGELPKFMPAYEKVSKRHYRKLRGMKLKVSLECHINISTEQAIMPKSLEKI